MIKQTIIMPDPIPFTKEGYEQVKKDMAALEVKRKTAVINLRTARDMGDLSENAAYKVARQELSEVDRRLRLLKFQLRFGVIVDSVKSDVVSFGRNITLSDGKREITFTLVGGYESDGGGRLSVKSPIGQAVLDKKLGETVTVRAPMGEIKYKIVKIS